MAMYNTCPVCGANLDPGEKCDCEKEKAPPRRATPFERAYAQVLATGNKWAIENFRATHF